MQRFIRRPEVRKITGYSDSTIWRMQQRGEFPQHIMISPRCAAWLESEVNDWISSRCADPATPSNHLDAARQQRKLVQRKAASC